MKTNRGFTLLEIMIAVVILATSIMALMTLQGNAFLASERAERLTSATLLARQKMAELEMEFAKDLAKNKFPDDNVEKEGDFEEPYDNYRWSYSIKKVEIPVVNPTEGEEGGEVEEGSEPVGAENILVGNYLKNVMDQISEAVRQVQLSVYWGDEEESQGKEISPLLTVTTHWVKLK